MHLRSPTRVIDSPGAILGFLERRSSRAMMIALDRLFGARSAVLYFLYSPFVRWTGARHAFVLALMERSAGRERAREMIKAMLMQPSARRYRFASQAAHLAPTAKELEAEGEAMLAAARDRPYLLELLAEFAITRGATKLAFKALRGLPENSGNRSAKLRAGIGALLPIPIRLLLEEDTDQSAAARAEDRVQTGWISGARSRHRLLVMGTRLNPVEIQQLAQGADALTLLVYRDLYGQIDINDLAEMLPGVSITVEHGRSRVDRFTERYNELHRRTASLADGLMQEAWGLLEQVIDLPVERDALLPWLTMEVADLVFFSALRTNAVHAAVTDDRFDDVIVSFGNDWRFYRLIAAISRSSIGSKLRVCCWSADPLDRRKFAQRLRAAVELSDRRFVRTATETPDDLKGTGRLARVRGYVTRVSSARRLSGDGQGNTPVLLVTSQERAYLRESTDIALSLQQGFDLDIFWTEGRPSRFDEEVARRATHGSQTTPRPGHLNGGRVAPTRAELAAFHALFREQTRSFVEVSQEAGTAMADPAVHVAFTSELEASIVPAVLKALGQFRYAAAAMRRYGYRCALISPIRNPRNAQLAAAARMLGIPTLAAEPHCLVASYCRHGAVPTDYVAVFGPYFAREYARHFAIPEERCIPIGSPRIQRPPDYDFERSRAHARQDVGLGPQDPPLVLFPTQPMPRALALEIWRMIVRASIRAEPRVRVLLKPHPEDGRERLVQYRQVIDAEGAGGICEVTNADFKPLVLASDLLFACYSVTALEAAVLDKRVAIVGLPEVEYPINYDEILAAPRCTSIPHIVEVMSRIHSATAAQAGPGPFRRENPAAFDADYNERLSGVVEWLCAQGLAAARPADTLPASPFVTAPFRPYMVAQNNLVSDGAP